MNERVTALRRMSMAAGLCLLVLMAMTLATGHSQQTFEFAGLPASYAARLLASATSLHWLVVVDDVFIACYVTATLMFARELNQATGDTALTPWIAGLGLAAGLLDFTENHHILSLLRLAQDSVPLDPAQLSLRETLSSLKWMAGHLAFFMVGVCLPATTGPLKALRSALLFVQLPVGAIALVMGGLPLGEWFNWARLLNVLVGFVFLAAVVPLPRANGSGAPA
ncbi:MAG: hypothetical protein EOP38_00775 [Rubrivivax sp.]|nr:MAG: hypothetical protein EOP38_00775 [Rubrivivax sp.]